MGPRKSVFIGAAVLVVVLALGLGWGVQRLFSRTPKPTPLPKAPLQTINRGRKAILNDDPSTYDALYKPPPKSAFPPRGIPVRQVEAAPSLVAPPTAPARPAPAVQPLPTPPGPSPAEVEARIQAAIAQTKAQMLEAQVRDLETKLAQSQALQAAQAAQGQGQAAAQKPAGKHASLTWFGGVSDTKTMNVAKAKGEDKKDGTPAEEPQSLIPRAKWARPLEVDKVLYWDQPIIAQLQTAINSDIPGEVRLKVIRAVWDRELRGREIIPALTSIKGAQDGSAKFGQERLNIGVDKMIFPNGTTLDFPKSRLADPQGSAGIPAEVNNHYGKMALGLLFSVGFNIGTRVAAGQPGGYQYNIQQEMAREAGQAVNREGQQFAQQFRIPPTLVAAPGDEVTLFASENINFSQLPVTVR